MKPVMLHAGAIILIICGAAHVVIPTRSVVEGFGPISADNKRTLLMEWLMEGVPLVFIGTLVILVTRLAPPMGETAVIVYRACAGVLVVLAGISIFTGARTAVLPMKVCPLVFHIAAALFFIPTLT